MIASVPIAHPQKTGQRNSESPIPTNETIVPPINPKPSNSNPLDIINNKTDKWFNDLVLSWTNT